MSLEGLKSFFEIGGVVLLAATFIFGAGALLVNSRISAIKSDELDNFKLRFEGERQKTAHAQQEAAEAKALAGGFERDIATANRGAAEANERATKAQASLASAEQHAAEANQKAEGFRLDIANANERAASANEIAERERLARLQLEARLADRVLAPAQQNVLVATLRPFSGTVIDIATFGDSAEVSGISRQVTECLSRAGWIVHPVFAGPGQATVKGILIGTRNGAEPNAFQASAALIMSLRADNLSADPWAFEQMPWPGIFSSRGDGMTFDAPIRLFIGSKP